MILLDNVIPFYISAATADTHTLVAAQTSKRIYIWRLYVWANAAVSVNFEDGTTDLGGVMLMAASSPINLPLSDPAAPYFVTTSGNAFAMTLSGAVQVSGFGLYSVI